MDLIGLDFDIWDNELSLLLTDEDVFSPRLLKK